MKPEADTQALEDPRCEIYAIERAAGLNQEDAIDIAGLEWKMPLEPSERLFTKRPRVATQALRRIDARIKVLGIFNDGVDKVNQREFWLRNLRAVAELTWFREVVSNSGVELDFDEKGRRIPTAAAKPKAAAAVPNDTSGDLQPAQEQTP